MSDDPAAARFAVIQLVRYTGVVLSLFGLLIIAGRIELPIVAGYVMFFVGLVDALVAPGILARRWKSPPP